MGWKKATKCAKGSGIVKYVPVPPPHMDGDLIPMREHCLDFDVDDAQSNPERFTEGDPVVVTEKMHGTCCILGYHPEAGPVIASKGFSTHGLAFDPQAERNKGNVYVNAWRAHGESIKQLHHEASAGTEAVYVLGEIAGSKIQDLGYGLNQAHFFTFDVYIGNRREGQWLDPAQVSETAKRYGWKTVPIIYEGPYEARQIRKLKAGPSRMERASHGREGIVVRDRTERNDPLASRRIEKHISAKHLVRSGGTEYT